MDRTEAEKFRAVIRDRCDYGAELAALAERLHTLNTMQAAHNLEGVNMALDILVVRQRKSSVLLDAELAKEGIDGPTNT